MVKRLVLASVVLALTAIGCQNQGGGAFQTTTIPATSTTAEPTTTAPTTTTPATTTVTAASTTTEPPVRTQTVIVLPAAFTPASNAADYSNNGSDLQVTGNTMTFFAPLSFAAPVVTLDSFTIIAYDNTPGHNVCVTLARSGPLQPQLLTAGQICTGDSPVFPQVREITDLDFRQVDTTTQGAFLIATFSGPGPSLTGVQVTYSY
jgi:hypothetical protein